MNNRTSNRTRIHVQKSLFCVLFCFVLFCFVFCFVCEITGESEKCNLREACTIAISGDRNFVMVLIDNDFQSCIGENIIEFEKRTRHLRRECGAGDGAWECDAVDGGNAVLVTAPGSAVLVTAPGSAVLVTAPGSAVLVTARMRCW